MSETTFASSVLVAGKVAQAQVLVLSAPISFWGGVDPKTGRIADVRYPEHGQSISGHVLCLPGTIGSSSAAAVLLELVHAGLAPRSDRSARTRCHSASWSHRCARDGARCADSRRV